MNNLKNTFMNPGLKRGMAAEVYCGIILFYNIYIPFFGVQYYYLLTESSEPEPRSDLEPAIYFGHIQYSTLRTAP